jgi:octaprenyl-diphosphate synthase
VTLKGSPQLPVSETLLEIQAPVREQLAGVGEELWRIVAADFPLIQSVSHHLMAMKGKMFRPTLVLLSSAVEGTPHPRARATAAVVELIHLATLVHDDAVDHSALRRGMPTINALFSHQISVIMGDYLYARALAELVGASEFESLRVMTNATIAMTVGEMRQLTSVDALSFSQEDYDLLIKSKTASLFSAACEAGALCGAARHRGALAHYGDRLGMAFQIADDLLDYSQSEDITGKPAGLDLKEHKVTLPLIAALREMSVAERSTVERLFDDPDPSDESVAEIIGIVAANGGLEYARDLGERYAAEAEDALAGLPDGVHRASLRDAIAYVMDRRS